MDWATFFLGRALEAFYNKGLRTKFYKQAEWHSLALISFSIGMCGYAYAMERRLMPKSLQRYFVQFLNFTKTEY
jgi:hypothetical protein